MTDLLPHLHIAGLVVLILMVILWTLLPFAVFGIKAKQDQQTRILRSVLKELRTLNAEQTPLENEIPEQEISYENKHNGD
ncbi:hypothetical protein [Methylotuvimicrobium alcaliphilum]|uniref:Transmembrane protein n=1 Tax=Methylotuvimicrobium alcaliphilum (strain DSM 19304 / NCIMB 14124 / VKM B-2133 / 20Z) TaxID=1091494 RepID=G4SZ10_META2|nr:hypothetical protein [Methylotuvimicrobium alcaliphilum]CCE25467.1 protein of unknown function [Methylotuvimicrobium alcaliphilum 20Z]